MNGETARQSVINKVHNLYLAKGFITEDEALACFAEHKIPLSEVDSITGYLLDIGIIFADDGSKLPEEEYEDYSQSDYDSIYAAALSISPNLLLIIDYVRHTRPPQWREWVNLMPKAKAGNQFAVGRLFDMYLRVVVKLAMNEHKSVQFDLEDLIQEGAMGLLRAIAKYDFALHGSFVSYFPFWIRQYMTRAVAGKSRLIRIPVHASKNMKHEIYSHLPLCDFQTVCEDDFVDDLLIGCANEDFCGLVEEKQLSENINEVLTSLKPREADVIRFRFGLDDGIAKTLEEVGTKYGVTRERIRQIETKALKRLRHPSRSKCLKNYYVE